MIPQHPPFELKNKTDYNNFVFVESRMPEILNHTLSIHASTGIMDLVTISQKLTVINPLKLNLARGHIFYEYKLKALAAAIGFGMRPQKLWHGAYNLSEVVAEVIKSNGDLVSKYSLPWDIEKYFFDNAVIKMANGTIDGAFYITVK